MTEANTTFLLQTPAPAWDLRDTLGILRFTDFPLALEWALQAANVVTFACSLLLRVICTIRIVRLPALQRTVEQVGV